MTLLETLDQQLLTGQDLAQRYPQRYHLDYAISRGLYRRVARGYYLHRSLWASLTDQAQYLVTLLAHSRLYPGVIFSHESAALLHTLPLEQLPEEVHLYSYYRIRAQAVRVHHGSLHLPTDTTVFLPGLRVTSLERTLEDLAQQSQGRAQVYL